MSARSSNGSGAPCGEEVNLSKHILEIPMNIGKGKRDEDLFEARRVLGVAGAMSATNTFNRLIL